MEILRQCQSILQVLKSVNEEQWSKFFVEVIENYSQENEQEIKRKIRSIYGGMGSFNDLVLHQNGRMVIEKNRELSVLRSTLFELIK